MRRTVFTSFLIVLAVLPLLLAVPGVRKYAGDNWLRVAKYERKLRYHFDLPLRQTPDLARRKERLAEKGMKMGDPIFMRIFKEEHELELWIKKGDGFSLFATYPVCRWSGRIGPKLKQGDKQAPEGFYTVARGQLNPNSRWHRSFNLGYPNVHDKAHGRTGDFLMVHGGCSSIGCYAMTNEVIDELWAFVTAALNKGQQRFHVQALPFRMSDWNLAWHEDDVWEPFWRDLKVGYDIFEDTNIPPVVNVCNGRYRVTPGKIRSVGNVPVKADCSAVTASSR